jgi:hypothetical protein
MVDNNRDEEAVVTADMEVTFRVAVVVIKMAEEMVAVTT